MIGNSYWSTGISLRFLENSGSRNGVPHSGWQARLLFVDDAFAGDDDATKGVVSTEGELYTRYFVSHPQGHVEAAGAAAQALRGDAERLGIEWQVGPILYIEGDGEDGRWPPPDGWRDLLAEVAKRHGWKVRL